MCRIVYDLCINFQARNVCQQKKINILSAVLPSTEVDKEIE